MDLLASQQSLQASVHIEEIDGTDPSNEPRPNKLPTKAEALAQFRANQHTVTPAPSNVIEIDEVPSPNQPKAISGNPGDKQDRGPKQKVKTNPKTEDQKPLDAADLRKRENSLRKKEEALKIREKRVEHLEKDLADAKAEIITLEAKIKDLEASNRLLNQRILAEKGNISAQPPPQVAPQPNASNHEPYGQATVQQPQHHATTSNLQILHQMEKMEIRMQYNQQISDIRQSFMMEKLNNLQNHPSPAYGYPGMQFPQLQSPSLHPWWGSAPVATSPSFATQQAMGLTIPSGARPVYPNANGNMHPSMNRYMPNPQMQPSDKTTPRVKPINVSPRRSQAEKKSETQKKAESNAPTSTHNVSNLTPEPAKQPSDARRKDSFLQAAGPTNHMTQDQNPLSRSEPTTSKM